MKKRLLFIFLISFLVLPVFYCFGQNLVNPPATLDIAAVLKRVEGLLIQIATPIAVICLIWAGFLFMTAQGEVSKIETAKKMFFWVLIGMAVVLFADASIQILRGMIGG